MGVGTNGWDWGTVEPSPWIEWFAILPVELKSGKHVWLKKVYMRQIWIRIDEDAVVEKFKRVVEYGTIFDVLASAE